MLNVSAHCCEMFGRKLVSRREVEAFEDSRGWPKGKTRKGAASG